MVIAVRSGTRAGKASNAPAVPSFAGPRRPSEFPLYRDSYAALQGINQILGVKFQLLQPHFFELLFHGEIRFLNQLFQPLSVATVFGVQAVNLFAQRGIVYFIHRRLLGFIEHLHIAPRDNKRQV